MSRRIDFFISNARHHWQAVRPVAELADSRGHDCHIVSLCELRGQQSPSSELSKVPVVPVFDNVSAPAREVAARTSITSPARRFLHAANWYLRLAPRFKRMLRDRRPDIVVIPNDLASPFNKLGKMLKQWDLRWALYQEGILFRLPPSDRRPYGAGGADAIAAWGQSAVEYFVDVAGAPLSTVLSVGSPRHDLFNRSQFEEEAAALRAEVPAGHKLIVFFGTTVDKPGGHCSTAEKLESIELFARSLAPLVDSDPFKLWVKPHSGEKASDYVELFQRSPISEHAEVRPQMATFPAVVASDGVIMNGSSIGLEALLLGARVGVIPVPRTGYPFDYGTSGVHVPIPANDGADAIRELLSSSVDDDMLGAYLEKHFANRPRAAEKMVEMLEEM